MKKKSVKKPIVPTQIPSDLEEFQSQYGGDWLNITRSPAFIAGTQLLNIRKLKSITGLSDEQIEKNGREILADLRGHLKHEDDLFTLHSATEFSIPSEEQDEYMSPEQAAQMESLMSRFREQSKKERYGI